ncbi:hypothetical protein K435DRAFT_839514 [Dendrothele bispora CBS 962.96]|uniref:Shelterin complex subunit TPP1/Est3 domain-containing protein n=1 Tax=Dendrothele bispora (strain CBS 962.96) TaxID=1314807 RepID=A0A4S8M013_DENBC|nr:hypothetical protein K435DRAFT_839514 [Dendrothele bispora CBS 962.96]
MSQSLLPWISSYLIEVAETYGANLASIPLSPKKRKVQLIEFLTFGSSDPNVDGIVWGIVSDKEYHIPVRFNQEAIADYRKIHQQRFTEVRTALITLKTFKVIFSRIPNRGGGLTKHTTLAFECKDFNVVGAIGEPRFAASDEIGAEPRLREWIIGLQQGGGGGNVLKERKEEKSTTLSHAETSNIERAAKAKATGTAQSTLSGKVIPKPKIQKNRPFPQNQSPSNLDGVDSFEREREKKWVIIAGKGSWHPKRPSDLAEIAEQLSVHGETAPAPELPRKRRKVINPLLSSQPESATSPVRSIGFILSRSATPVSNWPSSDREIPPSSPVVLGPLTLDKLEEPPETFEPPPLAQPQLTVPKSNSMLDQGTPKSSDRSSQQILFSLPTSIPKRISSPVYSQPLQSTPITHQNARLTQQKECHKSGNLNSPRSITSSPPSQRIRQATQSDTVPSSQPIKDSLTVDSKVICTPSPSQAARVTFVASATEMRRKVSPPPQPLPLPASSQSPKILAPNSDTSGTMSQSQSQSQLQSQSQPQSQSQEAFSQDQSERQPNGVAEPEEDRRLATHYPPSTKRSGGQNVIDTDILRDGHPRTAIEFNHDRGIYGEKKMDLAEEPSDDLHSLFGSSREQTPEPQEPQKNEHTARVDHDPDAWAQPSFMRRKELNGATNSAQGTASQSSLGTGTSVAPVARADEQERERLTENVMQNTNGQSFPIRVQPTGISPTPSNSGNEARLIRGSSRPLAGKVGGFTVGLDDIKLETPWISWERLTAIGLASGRARHKSFMQSSKG